MAGLPASCYTLCLLSMMWIVDNHNFGAVKSARQYLRATVRPAISRLQVHLLAVLLDISTLSKVLPLPESSRSDTAGQNAYQYFYTVLKRTL